MKNKTTFTKFLILLVLILGVVSCKNSKKDIDNLEIAKRYYNVLDNSYVSGIASILADSLFTKESDYEQTFSMKAYVDWMKWDSVFQPSYKILEIEEDNGIVNAKISKMDKRIFFLHKEPIITNQVIQFQKGKIISIETHYTNFNEKIFSKNKNELLSWIDKNHPELNGFIYDQTELGGIKYLKAIDLYTNRN
jgi:hypothetical protein